MMHYTDLPNGIKAYLHNQTVVKTSLFEAIRASITRWIWKTSYNLCCRLNNVPPDYDFDLVDLSSMLSVRDRRIEGLYSELKNLRELVECLTKRNHQCNIESSHKGETT